MCISVIPMDVITYVIIPYLRVSDVIAIATLSIIKPSKLLPRVIYKQPHGIVRIDDFVCHYRNGEIHSDTGPAVEYDNGDKYWYRRNKCCRDDGPAVECANGNKQWYSGGKHHRDGSPAVEHADGYKAWFIHGELHRDDGPAVEHADGYKAWFIHGERHRDDGPAVERANGYKAWYIHGERHRDNGPAVESTDGYKAWYIKDTKYETEELYNNAKSIDHDLHKSKGVFRVLCDNISLSPRPSHAYLLPSLLEDFSCE